MNISITIIGFNEENHLRELLPQLKWADEIVYVDCESEDASKIVAKENGCRVYSQPNSLNLNINKSYAIDKAKCDWIFYLDPDERITPSLEKELKNIHKDPVNSAFRLNRKNYCFGVWLKYGSQYPDEQIRFFRRKFAHFPNKHVHEKLIIRGNIGALSNDLLHYPYINISQFLKKFDFYTSIEAKYLLEDGVKINVTNTVKFLLFKPFTRFLRRYLLKRGFVDGFPGLFFAIFDALNFMVRYFKLWELLRTSKKQRTNSIS